MAIIEQIREIIKNNSNYLWSLLWTLLILFFAYTAQTILLFREGSTLTDVHIKAQCSLISMVVNFGIICMIVFDVKFDKDFRKDAFQWVVYSFVIIILMYVHSNIIDDTTLKPFIRNPQIGLFLGGIFILLTTHLKFLSKKRIEDIENKYELSHTINI